MMEEISLGPRLKTCFPTTKVKAMPNGAATKHPPSQRHCWLFVCFEEGRGGQNELSAQSLVSYCDRTKGCACLVGWDSIVSRCGRNTASDNLTALYSRTKSIYTASTNLTHAYTQAR